MALYHYYISTFTVQAGVYDFAEEAVRREVLEEAGLAVGPVAIVGSQPWPIGGPLLYFSAA